MKGLYLAVNFCTVIVPLIFSFHPRIRFYRNWKAFFAASALAGIVFVAWDMVFTSMGVWSFNSRYVTGINIFNLPVEEVLFFICVPFSCVFTFHCLHKFYALDWPSGAQASFSIVLSGVLLIVGSLSIHRAYTAVTLISTAMLILLLKFAVRVSWFGKAVSVYIVLLLPFLLVNGVLTGAGLKEPVVIYNNSENLGIRILTIPVEDIFYGFELFLLNLFFYELLLRRRPERLSLKTP